MESDRFGPYTVFECLGTGGMATVHRASIVLENDETREVALKRMLPQFAADQRFIDDFIREGKLAAHLQHPNIVRILELGRIGRTYFIAMDLVRGRPLMTLMKRAYQKKRPAPLGVVISLMTEVCDALEHAHEAQIVHRDLTPSNLIITNGGHLKIIDFGVAKALAGGLQTSSGLAKGKIGYMSMEAIGGNQLDTRADIFSAGVVMWELLATRRLFRGATDIEVIMQVKDGVIDPPSRYNPDCPPELDGIVLTALAQDKAQRWQSAAELRASLEHLCRYYKVVASARDVVAWMDTLHGAVAPRIEHDGENTEMHLDEADMFEVSDHGVRASDSMGSQRGGAYAHGSGAGTYDQALPLADEQTEIVAEKPRFKDSDTVVQSFLDRKP